MILGCTYNANSYKVIGDLGAMIISMAIAFFEAEIYIAIELPGSLGIMVMTV